MKLSYLYLLWHMSNSILILRAACMYVYVYVYVYVCPANKDWSRLQLLVRIMSHCLLRPGGVSIHSSNNILIFYVASSRG